jgi:hypothetical protein
MAGLVDPPANLKGPDLIAANKWFVYICCGGCGWGDWKDPLCGADVEDLTEKATCNTTSLTGDDGLCACINFQMNQTAQCQCPPVDGAPKCVCFNIPFVAGTGMSKKKGDVEYQAIFGDTWWYTYIFCGGYGCNGLKALDRPMIAGYQKFLIVEGSMGLNEKNEWPGAGNGMTGCTKGLCSGDNVCMQSVETCLCFYSQVKIPPEQGAKKCVCCAKDIIA